LLFLADAPNPLYSAPDWLNSGDTAWQLTSATLVGLMSLPGLAILYGGLVKKKWALNASVMCFYAFAVVLICWSLWGYSMSFGNHWLGIAGQWFLGVPHWSLTPDALIGQAVIPDAAAGLPPLRMPGSAMIYFQFVFAAITPLLIAGSVFGRMNFKAWMIFVRLVVATRSTRLLGRVRHPSCGRCFRFRRRRDGRRAFAPRPQRFRAE
jgi:Amt family ammonium transporter